MGQTENALCWHIKLAFGEGLFQVEIKLFPYFWTIIKKDFCSFSYTSSFCLVSETSPETDQPLSFPSQ